MQVDLYAALLLVFSWFLSCLVLTRPLDISDSSLQLFSSTPSPLTFLNHFSFKHRFLSPSSSSPAALPSHSPSILSSCSRPLFPSRSKLKVTAMASLEEQSIHGLGTVLRRPQKLWTYNFQGLDWELPSLSPVPSRTYGTKRQCRQQSPINIDPNTVKIGSPELDVGASFSRCLRQYTVTNNGISMKIEVEANNKALPITSSQPRHIEEAVMSTVWVDNIAYTANQFHFHSPAEHTFGSHPMHEEEEGKEEEEDNEKALRFDGKYERRQLEMHIVHTPADESLKDSGLVVLGLTFVVNQTDTPNPFLASLISVPGFAPPHILSPFPPLNLHELITGVGGKEGEDADLAIHLLRYEGSLTTPPLTEGVLWLIREEPVGISQDQLNKMNNALLAVSNEGLGNYRVIQNSPHILNNAEDVYRVRCHNPKVNDLINHKEPSPCGRL